MSISIEELQSLKKKAGTIRDKVIQAEATMKEVDNNIESIKKELSLLGIKDIDKADEEIQGLEDKAESIYDEAYNKIEKWL